MILAIIFIHPLLSLSRTSYPGRDRVQSVAAIHNIGTLVVFFATGSSVLGPVLFISYTDDVMLIFDSHQVNHHLYADDEQAYVSVAVNNVSLARQILERCIRDITS